jgi:hypothetical protein
LRKTKDHPLVVCAVARVLWADRNIGRARDWFGRSKQYQIHASIVSTLLALMDGMDGRGQVVVILVLRIDIYRHLLTDLLAFHEPI